MYKTGLEILAEMAKTEDNHSYEDLEAAMANIKFNSILKDMGEALMGDVKLHVEAVSVHRCSRLNSYLVEMGDICRYMRSNDVHSFKEAIKNVSEANSTEDFTINPDQVSLVIDEDAINNMIYEAKCAQKCKDKKFAKEKMQEVLDMEKVWDILESEGIKCVKVCVKLKDDDDDDEDHDDDEHDVEDITVTDPAPDAPAPAAAADTTAPPAAAPTAGKDDDDD